MWTERGLRITKVEPALNASVVSASLSLTVNNTACSFEAEWRVSSRTAPVRRYSAYFSTAWDRGTLARHRSQEASFANANITPELNCAAPKGARFREGGERHHFVYIIFAELLDFDISR
jgi:hypothetical protein